MLPHEIDPQSGIRMVGGEIPDWTDAETSVASAALGDLVASSAAGLAPGARVLLAGHAAVALRHRLPRDLAVHLLLRGLPDARSLAGHGANLAPDTTVIAGALDRLRGADEPFDLVVAFGGPEATLAPDSAPLSGLDWLRLVSDLARPGGRALASITNHAGMDRLVGSATTGDSGWQSLTDEPLDTLTLDDVRRFTGGQVLAAYPDISAPSVVLTEGEARTMTGPAQLAVRALSERFTDEPALRSPWRTSEQLFAAGLGLALAPAWVLMTEALPLNTRTTLPAGARLLESELRDAVGSRSHHRTRAVVSAYAAWLADLAASPTVASPSTANRRGAAGTATDLRELLVLDGGRIEVLDPTSQPQVTDADAALSAGLAAFAQRVCAEGVATLWDAPTVDVVLADLTTMAGREPSTAVPAASDSQLPEPVTHEAEVVRLHATETSLAETRRQVTWLEGTLRAKDRRIRTLERAIAVESSTAYKVVNQLGRPVPAVKRRAREFLDRRGRG